MHSKWKVWEFFKSNKTSLRFDHYGLHVISTFDPIIADMFKKKLPELSGGEKYKIVMGDEVTESWVEDNLQTLNLFGNSESFFVHFAEKIKPIIIEKIIDSDLLLDNRFIILSYGSKNEAYKAASSSEAFNSIEITEPMFWEYRELLEFLSQQLEVYLDYSASTFLIDSCEPSCQEYYKTLNQLGILHPKQTITIEMLKEIIDLNRLDQFKLADLFGSKKFTLFYKVLKSLDIDDISMRLFFMFMQKHMGKISDTRFLDNKKKLSKYDRQILSHSKIWNENACERSIQYFKDLEQTIKTQKGFYKHSLQRDYYRSF